MMENGKTNLDSKAGWFRYLEQIDDSNLVQPSWSIPSLILSHQEKRSAIKTRVFAASA